MASLIVAASTMVFSPLTSFGEDELAALANGEFKPDLVSSECFATSCKQVTKACVENADCKKGLMCTARCLGDSACITGCFARFGNEVLNDLLQCSIEDYKCINIAIITPGAQPPDEVPLPPKALATTFKPSSMEGTWYKVLGFNRQYDCFDCQKNTFSVSGDEATMDVDFSMSAKRKGREETANGQHMRESITFDPSSYVTPSGLAAKSRRTAHTEGRMFGLTFWENWYIIGENKPSETPFKFVYYTGKTLQNTYSGAFVYARTPTLPPDSMESVRKIARSAGMDPTKSCRIRNSCFAEVPEATILEGASPAPMSIASAGLGETTDFFVHEAVDARRFSEKSIDPPLSLRLKTIWFEILDYIEDPHEAARWMFDQQQQMIWEEGT